MKRSQKTDRASQKDFLLHRGMWPPTAGARRKLGTSVANGEGEDPRAGERVWEISVLVQHPHCTDGETEAH